MDKTKMKWMSERTVTSGGTTWGIPWKRGTLDRNESLKLIDENGQEIVVQTKAAAYWPDGSVKWTAHSAVFENSVPKEMYILKGQRKKVQVPVSIKKISEKLVVDTGTIICTINQGKSNNIIESIQDTAGNILCSGGRLVCLNENRFDGEEYYTTTVERFTGYPANVEIEEAGEVRTVIKISGHHHNINSRTRFKRERSWLPFELRLYFYAGQSDIKMIHTFIFDGNENMDFIRGICIEFDRPMQDKLYNRFVRLGGETGMFSESPKLLATWRTQNKYMDMYKEQLEGKATAFDEKEDECFLGLLDESPVWNDYKITQSCSAQYTIQKRTEKNCTFIKAGSGYRAMGIGCIGDNTSGAMIGFMRDFWQKCPSAIEIGKAAEDNASLKLWLWTPDAPAMDLRAYDTRTHVQSCYEGFDEMRSTPYGVANTNEIRIKFLSEMPTNKEIVDLAEEWQNPPLILCEPKHYYDVQVFGEWGLEDRSTSERAYAEQKIDNIIEYYYKEREQRDWYGFWDYGDIMHTYDAARHTWRYDMGGFAWQNAELVPNLFLWYGFLRSGREDIYRLAEAMTRHNSEVDMYHIGQYAGLGSRHNVVHWGCGCKEARISMAGFNKFLFYLTADERIGEVMDSVKDADYSVAALDPMRAYYPPDTKFKVHVRLGPDIQSFCSNWFTQWERHESTKYRDKLLKTLEFLETESSRFLGAGIFGYNPESKEGGPEYIDFELKGANHFMFCFGSVFTWSEIARDIQDEKLQKLMINLGLLYTDFIENKQKAIKDLGIPESKYTNTMYNSGMSAIAAKYTHIDGLSGSIWDNVLYKNKFMEPYVYNEIKTYACHKNFIEIPNISGNDVGLFGTNVIVCLENIGDKMTENRL